MTESRSGLTSRLLVFGVLVIAYLGVAPGLHWPSYLIILIAMAIFIASVVFSEKFLRPRQRVAAEFGFAFLSTTAAAAANIVVSGTGGIAPNLWWILLGGCLVAAAWSFLRWVQLRTPSVEARESDDRR